ncbi:type VI secretion system-associated FHA domain protein TagH [Aquabacter sp. CN5-332]
MHARLTVTSEQGQSLGPSGFHEFGPSGGIIGRSGTCDWRLPDPTHTLSARHAEIRFNGQGFLVVDLSTNGVYVNSIDAPIGRGNTAVLVSGDQIYIGNYIITVEIVRAAQDAAPAQPIVNPLPQAPLGAPSAFTARPVLRSPPPAPSPGAFQGTLDPLAALDGADMLQETNNPFGDLGIGHRDRETTDSGLRSLSGRQGSSRTSSGGIPAFDPAPLAPPSRPVPPPPPPEMPPRQPAASSTPIPVIPADFGLTTPPPPPAPAPVVRADFAPPPPPRMEAEPAPSAIPPNFLDELSLLIPKLAEGTTPAPIPPTPAQSAVPAAALDDPEQMVTLLRMRGKAKAPAPEAAPPQPAPPLAPPPQALPPQAFAPQALAPQVPPPVRAAIPESAPFLPPSQLMPPVAVIPAPAAPPPSQNPEAEFWKLFGVDGAQIAPAERARLLGDAAGLIRSLVDGMIALQATRRSLKGELHLEATQLVGEANPFKTARTAEEALAHAVGGGSFGRMDASAAARAVFEDMRVHEMAAMEAMQATIARLMQRISPAAIAFEVEGEGSSGGVFARKADKMKLWDRYLVMHERLVDALDVISPELVGQEFARAYAQHAQNLRRGDV